MSENPKHGASVHASLLYGTSNTQTKYYDIRDFVGNKMLDYCISKIICPLKSNEYILGIKVIGKSRSDGSEKILLDTGVKDDKTNQEFVLDPVENIVNMNVRIKDRRLIGFEVITNRGRTNKFGYGEVETKVDILDLVNGKQILVGFGVAAGADIGVAGIYCYFLDKKEYSIVLHTGALYLKLKMKDKDFKEKAGQNAPKDNKELYTLYKVCALPDNQFFGVMKYAFD